MVPFSRILPDSTFRQISSLIQFLTSRIMKYKFNLNSTVMHAHNGKLTQSTVRPQTNSNIRTKDDKKTLYNINFTLLQTGSSSQLSPWNLGRDSDWEEHTSYALGILESHIHYTSKKKHTHTHTSKVYKIYLIRKFFWANCTLQ